MKSLTQKRGKLLRVPQDALSIQEAFDRSADGDCVVIASGAYTISEPLMITNQIHIIGVNETGERASIHFNVRDLKPATPMLRIDAPSCHLRGVDFDYQHDADAADGSNAFAVTVARGDVMLDSCSFRSTCCGIKVAEQAYVTCRGVGSEAAFVAFYIAGKAFLDRCDITSSRCGLLLKPTGSAACESLRVAKCGMGICVEGHASLRLESSLIEECEAGAHITDDTSAAKPPLIRGNEFRSCRRGLYLRGESCACEVSKNYFHQCTGSAITLDGGVANVSCNAIKSCDALGMEVLGGRPIIESNIVQGCAVCGILVTSSASLPTIVHNELLLHVKEGSTAMIVEDSAAPRVESNSFSGNCANLKVQGGLGFYTSNALLQAQQENVVISAPGASAVLQNNKILGSTSSFGVCIRDGAHATITENTIAECKLSGISLRGCGKTDIRNNTLASCQDAIVALEGAVATIGKNQTILPVNVFSDATDSTVVEP